MAAPERSDADKAKIRLASGVIIVAMLVWLAANFLGGAIGLPPRFAFLFDLAAMAAFIWSLFVLLRVWRAGPSGGGR